MLREITKEVCVVCNFSRGGHPAGAKEVFEAMTQAGVRADHVSYNILIDAFGRAGLTAGMDLNLVVI